MERSFGSKYGKWIALTAVVLALVLWFVLSGGVENYRAKYEGYDLTQQIGDIGRSSTYSLYLRAHEGSPNASSDVSIPLVTVDSDGVTAQKDGLLMQSGSSATFAVTVPETGFYNIRLKVDENGKYYNAAETDAFLEAMNWVMDMVSKYEMKAPEGAEWNYFESAFINGEVALQVHEDYFAGSLANMEDDYGFVFFPKGPRAETYLYAPSDNIMVIPACYDADRAWKIAFAYNLFTNPTPGYTDSDDWKNGYYQKYRDERAVDETITMMREPEHQFVWYSDMVTGYDLGSQYIWDVYAQATTPAEKAESMRGTWQAYIDEANAN